MGTVGDCPDNAMMGSFWGTVQLELLDKKNGEPGRTCQRHLRMDRMLVQSATGGTSCRGGMCGMRAQTVNHAVGSVASYIATSSTGAWC
jgi:hypothetical protein